MNGTTILITMKLKRKPKFKDIEVCMQEGVTKTIELINKWVDKGDILAVISFEGNAIREDFIEDIKY